MTKLINTWSTKLIPIHENPKTIKPFFRFYKTMWLLGIVLIIVSSILFFVAGARFDDGSSAPENYEIGYIVSGTLVFVIGMLFLIFISFIIPIIFKKSQEEFTKTKLFQENKIKFNKENFLKKLSKKELKKYKKLLYIDSHTYSMFSQSNKKPQKTKK